MTCCHNIKFCLVNHLDSNQLPSVEMTGQFDHRKVAPAQGPTEMIQSAEIGATRAAPGEDMSILGWGHQSGGVHFLKKNRD